MLRKLAPTRRTSIGPGRTVTRRDVEGAGMARLTRMGARGTRDSAAEIYVAAERFIQAALRTDGSIFTPDRPIWTLDNLDEFYRRHAGNPQEGKEEFMSKLLRQLEGAGAD